MQHSFLSGIISCCYCPACPQESASPRGWRPWSYSIHASFGTWYHGFHVVLCRLFCLPLPTPSPPFSACSEPRRLTPMDRSPGPLPSGFRLGSSWRSTGKILEGGKRKGWSFFYLQPEPCQSSLEAPGTKPPSLPRRLRSKKNSCHSHWAHHQSPKHPTSL